MGGIPLFGKEGEGRFSEAYVFFIMDSLVTRKHFFLDNLMVGMVVLYIKPWFYMDSLEGRTKRSGQKSGIWFRR
jgi:hypothetical protein